jgi:hypothetical protein
MGVVVGVWIGRGFRRGCHLLVWLFLLFLGVMGMVVIVVGSIRGVGIV